MPRLHVEQLALWKRSGFLHVPGLLDAPRTQALQTWIDEIATDEVTGFRHHDEETRTGVRRCRTEDLVDHHIGLDELLRRGTIPDITAELVGEPVLLYKEKVNYKPPGGAGFHPHQDAAAYRFISKHVTCMIAVDPATRESGCLELAAGRFNELLPPDETGCIAEHAATALAWTAVEMEPGDALWFHSRAPHRSPSNGSSQSRRALFATYNAASEGDARARYYADRERQLREGGATTGRISTIGHFAGRTAPVETETP